MKILVEMLLLLKEMNEKDWYKEWFNSPYYHLLYQYRDEEEAENFVHAVVHHARRGQGDGHRAAQ